MTLAPSAGTISAVQGTWRRAAAWTLALELALLAALLAAIGEPHLRSDGATSALALPLMLLQLPGWIVATACRLWVPSIDGPTDPAFAAVVGVVNLPVIYLVIRAAGPGATRTYASPLPTIALAALVPMYMAIAAAVAGRTMFTPSLAIDQRIPLQAGWASVYLSQAVFTFLPLFVLRGVELRRRTVIAHLVVVLVAYASFLMFPTVGPRPVQVVGDGFSAWMLRGLYDFDPPYNCFPSLHVAYSVLAGLACWRMHRGLGAAAMAWAGAIALSTLFTRQHYVADVAGGIVLAWVAWSVSLRGMPANMVAAADRRRAPRRALVAVAINLVVVAWLWMSYLMRAS